MKKSLRFLNVPLLAFLLTFIALPGEAATKPWSETWKPDPETVKNLESRQTGVIYDEDKVPSISLPKILETADGKDVKTVEDWEKIRRPEILRLFRENVYGFSPEKIDRIEFTVTNKDPDAMGGAATLKQVAITMWKEQRKLTMNVVIFLPNDRTKPVPVFLLINHRGPENIDPTRKTKEEFWPAEEVIKRGYGIAGFQAAELDPDKHDGFKNGVHGWWNEEHKDNSWGTLAAWAWGASRAMDYFEKDDDIDGSKVAVLGHSRGGKTALWAGAQDQRFSIVISNNSGCGGAALSRRRFGEKVERINKSFPHWFCGNFDKFNNNENDLPVDQHMLISLMAPRGVYVASASDDLWADPKGEYLSLYNASSVYELYGLEGAPVAFPPPADKPVQFGNMGYHIRSGGHGLYLYDWQRYMDFADKIWNR